MLLSVSHHPPIGLLRTTHAVTRKGWRIYGRSRGLPRYTGCALQMVDVRLLCRSNHGGTESGGPNSHRRRFAALAHNLSSTRFQELQTSRHSCRSAWSIGGAFSERPCVHAVDERHSPILH